MSRGVWFVAGAGAGVYAMLRARRAAEVLTPEGLSDRWAGLSLGARLFADEVRAGRDERETELRDRLGLTTPGPAQLMAPPVGRHVRAPAPPPERTDPPAIIDDEETP